jgi:cytochrome c553
MRHARVLGYVGIAAAFAVAAVAFAQSTVTPVAPDAQVQTKPLVEAKPVWGDEKRGAQKAGTCAACHGLDGNPTDPQYPRLAGMPERYIAHQLELFKNGQRTTGMAAVMKPFADALTAQDMRDLGAHFAMQKAGAGVADDTVHRHRPQRRHEVLRSGRAPVPPGRPGRGIPACMACHGPAGAGNPGPAYPAIAGQQSAYAQRRLEEYRAGTTTQTDAHQFNIMASVAKPLTDEEIQSLASYVQGLHKRSDDATASQ